MPIMQKNTFSVIKMIDIERSWLNSQILMLNSVIKLLIRSPLYQILWMNSYAFNISPSIVIPTGDILDIPAFMNNINKEITRLYTAIRKAITRLD